MTPSLLAAGRGSAGVRNNGGAFSASRRDRQKHARRNVGRLSEEASASQTMLVLTSVLHD
jgi:hypothetical protein